MQRFQMAYGIVHALTILVIGLLLQTEIHVLFDKILQGTLDFLVVFVITMQVVFDIICSRASPMTE